MQTLATRYIPQAYQLGKIKVQQKYGVVVPWGDKDNVNIELLLTRHAEELSRTMANMEQLAAEGRPLSELIDNLIKRASSWSWVLSPALSMGTAAYIDSARSEISEIDDVEPNDIGIIWLTAEDSRVCPKCLLLAGRWFDAREAYHIAATIHPGCRCSAHFDVGTPDTAMVGPLEGYRPGMAQDVYRDLNIAGQAQARRQIDKRVIDRERRRHIVKPQFYRTEL
ncbi:hypothetical protein [Dehalococcoides mccartyi]|uniref:hypothetical protein n=1 Tax=Dehalococcoides mccartyi TaxID=61435 RepID=UPI0026EE81C0|nr:hypothetical protein [Dehalococcoides mccartyi]